MICDSRMHRSRQISAFLVVARAGREVDVGGEHPGELLVGAPCAAYGVMVISSGSVSMLPSSVCSAMTSHHCAGGTAYPRSGTTDAVPIKTGTGRLW